MITQTATEGLTAIDFSATEIGAPRGGNNFVEFVRVSIQLDHSIPRDVGLELISPQGTVVNIMLHFMSNRRALTSSPSSDGSLIMAWNNSGGMHSSRPKNAIRKAGEENALLAKLPRKLSSNSTNDGNVSQSICGVIPAWIAIFSKPVMVRANVDIKAGSLMLAPASTRIERKATPTGMCVSVGTT